MIDNIVENHLLLSDYRLERWLLRYSQKSADGGGGGGSENSVITQNPKIQEMPAGSRLQLHCLPSDE